MTAESNARSHVDAFAWHRGRTEFETINTLMDLRALRDAVEQATATVVIDARLGGASWSEIGEALGITRQAAQQRYRSAGILASIRTTN